MRMSATWICLAILARPAFADDPKPYPVPVQPDPGDPKPYPVPVNPPPDQKPPEQKPPEQKPPEQKPPEQKPPEQKPPEQKPPEQPPPQTKPPEPPKPPPQQPPLQRIDPPSMPPDSQPRDTPAPRPRDDTPPEQISNEPLNGSEKIAEIIVKKNTKTTADTVELIAKIDVGDDFTADMIERIRHDLVSSGLFSDVDVYWDRLVGKKDVRVHLLVEDKHSWVIAPAFYNQPTNTGVGVGYGENNLFGLNQKLLIYGQIATGDSFFVGAWQIPSLWGTRFHAQLDTYLASIRNFEYAPPINYISSPKPVRESRLEYLNAGIKVGVDLFRGVRIDTRLRAAKVSYPTEDVKLAEGATLMDVTSDPTLTMPPKPGKEGTDISHEIDLTIDRRANWYGVQTGYKYTVSYEYASSGLGSDFHYNEFGIQLFRAYQVLERHNLVLKGNFQYGHRLPFQQEFLMGGTSMRGWVNNQFRGDLKALANIEYSLPLFTVFGLGVRGLGFFDSGYTAFLTTSNPERNYLPSSQLSDQSAFAPFKNSIGVGTRLYLRQIVLPLLGLDIGYGLEAKDYQVYLAIGLTD